MYYRQLLTLYESTLLFVIPLGVATSTDWLSQAAMSAADADGGRGGETKNVVRHRNSLVTTGGWISMKLGLPVDEEYAFNRKGGDKLLFKRASQRALGYGP